MQKLKLNWDELVVESFATLAESRERGTVQGHLSAYKDTCNTLTDELSCPGTCEPNTCDEFCGPGDDTAGCGTGFTCEPTAPAGDTCCHNVC